MADFLNLPANRGRVRADDFLADAAQPEAEESLLLVDGRADAGADPWRMRIFPVGEEGVRDFFC